MNEAVKKSSGRDDDLATTNRTKNLAHHTDHCRRGALNPIRIAKPPFNEQALDGVLPQMQIRGLFEHALHVTMIKPHIGLSPRRPDGWSLGAIENTKLNAGRVDGFAHFTAKCVHFFYEVTLRGAANGWITTHRCNAILRLRHQHGTQSHTRGRQRSFTTRMTSAHDDDVVKVGWL